MHHNMYYNPKFNLLCVFYLRPPQQQHTINIVTPTVTKIEEIVIIPNYRTVNLPASVIIKDTSLSTCRRSGGCFSICSFKEDAIYTLPFLTA